MFNVNTALFIAGCDIARWWLRCLIQKADHLPGPVLSQLTNALPRGLGLPVFLLLSFWYQSEVDKHIQATIKKHFYWPVATNGIRQLCCSNNSFNGVDARARSSAPLFGPYPALQFSVTFPGTRNHVRKCHLVDIRQRSKTNAGLLRLRSEAGRSMGARTHSRRYKICGSNQINHWAVSLYANKWSLEWKQNSLLSFLKINQIVPLWLYLHYMKVS